MRITLVTEVIFLVLLMMIEGIYTPNVVLSLAVIVGLIFSTQICLPRHKSGRLRLSNILLLTNFLMFELFFMYFSQKVKDMKHSPRLPLPYKEIGNLAYGLLYLTIIVSLSRS